MLQCGVVHDDHGVGWGKWVQKHWPLFRESDCRRCWLGGDFQQHHQQWPAVRAVEQLGQTSFRVQFGHNCHKARTGDVDIQVMRGCYFCWGARSRASLRVTRRVVQRGGEGCAKRPLSSSITTQYHCHHPPNKHHKLYHIGFPWNICINQICSAAVRSFNAQWINFIACRLLSWL